MKKMKKHVYLFVFDGFADWQVSYATVGLSKSGGYKITTIGITKDPVVSMGGLTVVPDVDFIPGPDLADLDDTNTAMLILPGGAAWEKRMNEAVAPLVAHCLLHGIPIAAIGSATLFLADAGILNRISHTTNDASYLGNFTPVYRGRPYYQGTPSVATDFVITAAAQAAVEFAGDIFDVLSCGGEEEVREWFQYFDNRLVYS